MTRTKERPNFQRPVPIGPFLLALPSVISGSTVPRDSTTNQHKAEPKEDSNHKWYDYSSMLP